MYTANERRHYKVTPSLIGWVHTQIDPCYDTHSLSLFYSPAWIYHSAVVSILIMRPANERRRYKVTSSLIGWAHTQIDPCYDTHSLSLFCSPAWIYHSAVVSILIMRPANERRRYYVTSSLIDWAHTQIDPSQSKPVLLTCMDLPQCSSVLEGPPHTAMDQLWPFHGSGTPKSLGRPLDGLWRYSRKKSKNTWMHKTFNNTKVYSVQGNAVVTHTNTHQVSNLKIPILYSLSRIGRTRVHFHFHFHIDMYMYVTCDLVFHEKGFQLSEPSPWLSVSRNGRRS